MEHHKGDAGLDEAECRCVQVNSHKGEISFKVRTAVEKHTPIRFGENESARDYALPRPSSL